MQRVMIIGCSGAGKSTFSKKLGEITELEVIHLDQYYWKPNWQEAEPNEWKDKVEELSKKKSWIMDGNYTSTMDIRISRADTIIFLNYPTMKCLWRVTKRTVKYWKKRRPDMLEGCKERFNLKFYHYISTFNLRRRNKLLKKLEQHAHHKRVLIFKNDIETNNFLEKLNSYLSKL